MLVSNELAISPRSSGICPSSVGQGSQIPSSIVPVSCRERNKTVGRGRRSLKAEGERMGMRDGKKDEEGGARKARRERKWNSAESRGLRDPLTRHQRNFPPE